VSSVSSVVERLILQQVPNSTLSDLLIVARKMFGQLERPAVLK